MDVAAFFTEAFAIVLYFKIYIVIIAVAPNGDQAMAADLGNPVFDGIFHDGLKDDFGHQELCDFGLDIVFHIKLSRIAQLLYGYIAGGYADFIFDGNSFVPFMEAETEEPGELHHHLFYFVLALHYGDPADSIQGIV